MTSPVEIRKLFYAHDMPQDVYVEVCDESGGGIDIRRVYLTGYDSYPLTRKWLLENGAEEADRFVLVCV